MNLSTVEPSFPQVHIKWNILNTQRPSRYSKQWPYYSSNFSFPGSRTLWYLKLTDDYDFYAKEDKVKEANDYVDECGTRYVLSICRRPGVSSSERTRKLKVYGSIGIDRNRGECLDLFVHLKGDELDTVIEAGTLFDKWDNGTQLTVDLYVECEPCHQVALDNQQAINQSQTGSTGVTTSLHRDIMDFIDDVTRSPANVTLVGSDGSIGAHKVILCLRSDVFRNMFENEFSSNTQIDMKDISKRVLADFVHFLTTDTVSNIREHVHDLLSLSEKYNIRKLKEVCEDFASNQVNEKNQVRQMPRQSSTSQLIERRIFDMVNNQSHF
ncbi:putative protein5 [Halotydeus destructor]|nr:putative protein5 [Halotydeus destructor]